MEIPYLDCWIETLSVSTTHRVPSSLLRPDPYLQWFIKLIFSWGCNFDFRYIIFKCVVETTFMSISSAVIFRWMVQDHTDVSIGSVNGLVPLGSNPYGVTKPWWGNVVMRILRHAISAIWWKQSDVYWWPIIYLTVCYIKYGYKQPSSIPASSCIRWHHVNAGLSILKRPLLLRKLTRD